METYGQNHSLRLCTEDTSENKVSRILGRKETFGQVSRSVRRPARTKNLTAGLLF